MKTLILLKGRHVSRYSGSVQRFLSCDDIQISFYISPGCYETSFFEIDNKVGNILREFW